MKYVKLASTILMAVLILSGCKQELASTLYVRDLVETVSSDKVMTTPAEIKLEMPTKKSCAEKKNKLTRVISPFFNNLEKTQCIQEGSDAFCYAGFEIPMITVPNDGNLSNNYKGGISAHLKNNNGQIDVYLSMKSNLLKALDKNLEDEFMGSGGIDPEDMTIKISINNDARNTYVLFVEGAFLDGQAIISRFGQTIELDRRSEAVIKLADVSVFALTGRGKTNFAYVGTVAPKPAEDEKK